VTLLAATFGFALLSAIVPIANIEAFLAAGTAAGSSTWWALALVATAGQMLGKVGFYLLGRESTQWAWVRRRTAGGKAERWLARLTLTAERRPWSTWLVVAASAVVGIPPFAIVSVLAGQVRVPLVVFLVVGSAGRFVRFAAIVLGVESLTEWF